MSHITNLSRHFFWLSLCLLTTTSTIFAQQIDKPGPTLTDQPALSPSELSNTIRLDAPRQPLPARSAPSIDWSPLATPVTPAVGQVYRMQAHPLTGLPDWVQLSPVIGTPESQCQQWFQTLAPAWGINKADEAFQLTTSRQDRQGDLHLHWQQVYRGIPVYGNEIKAHFQDGQLTLLNGRVFPETEINTSPTLSAEEAIAHAKAELEKSEPLNELDAQQLQYLGRAQYEAKLTVFQEWPAVPRLAYTIEATPNLAAHYHLMIDAHTGEVLRSRDHLCHFLPPNVTEARDLSGQLRTIHSYRVGSTNYLIDASRSMFQTGSAANLPNDGVGIILTANADNQSPQSNSFAPYHNTSSGNFWEDRLAVSAHYNAGLVHSYFEQTFGRNSINGEGGNVYSFINVADDDGSAMDNAFWNGLGMYYGNGNTDFVQPLARALDVAGHEMAHGVIQHTANLEYYGESGALNESFADIFGAMIDREDWQMGEDVVSTSVFRSGALRDMADPHNGGNRLGDPGWQPSHVDEQYRGEQDNAGVHINSGIPNHAYYLFATAVGQNVAEQIFYEALDQYLTRSSQFIDLRAAVLAITAADYPNNVQEAAANAFAAVGLGSGGSGGGGGTTDPFVDLPSNPGAQYVLFTEGNNNDLHIKTPSGIDVAVPLSSFNPYSRPSITDDGSYIVFVDEDRILRYITLDWFSGTATPGILSDNPIWRNAAISRDGLRLAALIDDNDPGNDNEVLVFDLSRTEVPTQAFTLYNPTYTEGLSTGDVQYADVLEWDHAGENLLYDAYNILPSQNGLEIDYWDIGFIRVWDREANNFGDGFISKLFSGLPQDVSVGNPTFSKNSPYIIALDFVTTQANRLVGVNIETGDLGNIFDNAILNYPNFSVLDDQIIFNAQLENNSQQVIAFSGLQSNKIQPNGNPGIFFDEGFTGARWGVWFANGQRELVDTEDLTPNLAWAKVYPTVSKGQFTIEWQLEQTTPVQLEVRDMLGRLLQQQTLSAQVQRQNIEIALPSGNYVISLRSAAGMYSQRLIIE